MQPRIQHRPFQKPTKQLLNFIMSEPLLDTDWDDTAQALDSFGPEAFDIEVRHDA